MSTYIYCEFDLFEFWKLLEKERAATKITTDIKAGSRGGMIHAVLGEWSTVDYFLITTETFITQPRCLN